MQAVGVEKMMMYMYSVSKNKGSEVSVGMWQLMLYAIQTNQLPMDRCKQSAFCHSNVTYLVWPDMQISSFSLNTQKQEMDGP